MFKYCITALFIAFLSNGVHAMDKQQVTLVPKLLKDNSGLIYIGYPVSKDLVTDHLAQLKTHVGAEAFTVLRDNQAARDHDSFHITLINPFEHPDIKSISLHDIPPIRFEFVGVGSAEGGANQSYFVVVNAKAAQQVRADYKLKPKDFHITLGFDAADVFGVSKGVDSLLSQ